MYSTSKIYSIFKILALGIKTDVEMAAQPATSSVINIGMEGSINSERAYCVQWAHKV
jgi:hypothetical protein